MKRKETTCLNTNCQKNVFSKGFCKYHLCTQLKLWMSREFRDLFRSPESAYTTLDFNGKGYVTQEDFLNCIVVKRLISQKIKNQIQYSIEDVVVFLQYFSLFPLQGGNRQTSSSTDSILKISNKNLNAIANNDNGSKNDRDGKQNGVKNNSNNERGVMIFDTFKKIFFPHLHQTYNISDALNNKGTDGLDKDLQISNRMMEDPEYVKEKLIKLDLFLKDKFAKFWVSVRKAFLDLDSDHDGYVTVEDVIKYFGQENDLNYQDVKKLLENKDLNKSGKGLNYQDFSRWIGNAIHSVQGFYFRHDSVLNPVFEKNTVKHANKIGKYQNIIAANAFQQQELKQKILQKIQQQWKTIKKSFHDLNKDKHSGSIEPHELKFYFNHWGFVLNDETFKQIYEELDYDKDGRISYSDFQKTVGCEIHPGENLYFRQDQPQNQKITTCQDTNCWQPTKQNTKFCHLHYKVNYDQCLAYLIKVYKHIGKRWGHFIREVKRKADPQDQNQINIDTLRNLLQKYNLTLDPEYKERLLDVFLGEDEGQRILVNIQVLYQMSQHDQVAEKYKNTVIDDSDHDDNPVDLSGYTGEIFRQKMKLQQISENEVYQVMTQSELKFVKVMRIIRNIDKDNNGYVTITELDDILKLQYPESFQGKDLTPTIKKFRSIQNRILVDYKKFREKVIEYINQMKSVDLNLEVPRTQIDSKTMNEKFNENHRLNDKSEHKNLILKKQNDSNLDNSPIQQQNQERNKQSIFRSQKPSLQTTTIQQQQNITSDQHYSNTFLKQRSSTRSDLRLRTAISNTYQNINEDHNDNYDYDQNQNLFRHKWLKKSLNKYKQSSQIEQDKQTMRDKNYKTINHVLDKIQRSQIDSRQSIQRQMSQSQNIKAKLRQKYQSANRSYLQDQYQTLNEQNQKQIMIQDNDLDSSKISLQPNLQQQYIHKQNGIEKSLSTMNIQNKSILHMLRANSCLSRENPIKYLRKSIDMNQNNLSNINIRKKDFLTNTIFQQSIDNSQIVGVDERETIQSQISQSDILKKNHKLSKPSQRSKLFNRNLNNLTQTSMIKLNRTNLGGKSQIKNNVQNLNDLSQSVISIQHHTFQQQQPNKVTTDSLSAHKKIYQGDPESQLIKINKNQNDNNQQQLQHGNTPQKQINNDKNNNYNNNNHNFQISVNNSDTTITTFHSQLAERIKDFRREINMDKNTRKCNFNTKNTDKEQGQRRMYDESVRKFRNTMSNFGINISNQVRFFNSYDISIDFKQDHK